MVANIGGASAYPNVRDHLLEIENYTDIPDFIIIQEPGTDENFKPEELEPFVSEYRTYGKIRLHHHQNINPDNLEEIDGIDGFSFNTSIKIGKIETTILVVAAYRCHSISKDKFFKAIDKHIDKRTCSHVVLCGDFNTHPDNPLLLDIIDKFKLCSMTDIGHQHRSTDSCTQIDYILTNLPAPNFEVSIQPSLENKALLNSELGHKCFKMNLDPAIKQISCSIKKIDWKRVV